MTAPKKNPRNSKQLSNRAQAEQRKRDAPTAKSVPGYRGKLVREKKTLKYHGYTGETVAIATREAIHAYKQAGDTLKIIAEKTKLGINLIQAVLRLYPPSQPLVDKIKKGLAGKLYRVADNSLDQIEPDSLLSMSPYQNMGIAGLAITNARVIEGLPTEIHNIQQTNLSLVQINQQKADLVEKHPWLNAIEAVAVAEDAQETDSEDNEPS